MAAPQGNKNAVKGKAWEESLRLALANFEDKEAKVKRGEALRKIADGVVLRAITGDKDAVKEIGDRLDGKPAQAITGGDGGPLQVQDVPWLRERRL